MTCFNLVDNIALEIMYYQKFFSFNIFYVSTTVYIKVVNETFVTLTYF
jgi:hypothetical protein